MPNKLLGVQYKNKIKARYDTRLGKSTDVEPPLEQTSIALLDIKNIKVSKDGQRLVQRSGTAKRPRNKYDIPKNKWKPTQPSRKAVEQQLIQLDSGHIHWQNYHKACAKLGKKAVHKHMLENRGKLPEFNDA